MTVPDPDNASESSDGEVDPFEELGVQANVSNASVSDGLEAFMEDEEDDDIEATTEPIIESEEDDDDDDDDVFATLGVAGPAVALTSSGKMTFLQHSWTMRMANRKKSGNHYRPKINL